MISQDGLINRYGTGLNKVDIEMAKLYGRRYLEYRKNYILAGKLKYEPDFPLYLMLEQTFRCNLKCPICIQGLPEYKKRFNPNVNIMPFSLFERIVLEAELHSCPSIAFHDNDEPLLVKDLPRRVFFAKKHGFMDLFLTTNGTLLSGNIMQQLIDAGITRILFSLDAASPETYKKLRRGGDFLRILKNLFALLDYKKKNKLVLPAVRLSFVVNRLNAHELRIFIKKFSKKVDYLEIQPLSIYYHLNKYLIPEHAYNVKAVNCSEPWRKLIIRANGDVLPCCSFYGYELVLANCLKTSLKDIFQSARCRGLRQDFKKNIYRFPACLSCSRSIYITKGKF